MDSDRWREIRTAFDELVELPLAARAERLAGMSTADAELGRAVEALLQADTGAEEELAMRLPSLYPAADRPGDPLGLTGRMLGHFRILAPLSTGGMGVVYTAEDTRLGRPVAVKVPLPAHRLDPSARARFLQEARSVGALDHPNLCSLYEAGETEDGVLYLAMALYRGETLKARLAREGALPVSEAIDIARQICRGLAAAHERGIVHRDLKPANVMLPAGGAVKILDFGLAKVSDVSLTGGRALLGTVGYMSPEQIRNRAVDGRADLWALGVVLYEMLTGRQPFRGDPEVAVAHAIVHEAPVQVSALRVGIPAALQDLVMDLLQKDPARRPARADLVHRALDAAATGRPRRAAAARRWLRVTSHRAAVVAGLLIVIAALALAGLRHRPAVRLDRGVIAVLPFRVVSGDPTHAALREGMVDILEVEFSTVGGARVVPARTALAVWRETLRRNDSEITEADARTVARRLGAGTVILGTVVGMPGRLTLSGSMLDTEAGRVRTELKAEGEPDSLHALVDRFAAQIAALGAGERAGRLASLTSTSLPALYAYLAGTSAYRAGQYDTALRYFGRALELDSAFARAAFAYRRSAAWIGDPPGMARGIRSAWAHRERLGPRDRVLLEAAAGPRSPELPQPRERIAAWEQAVGQVPDEPEAWYELGDAYFHAGAVAGVDEPFRHAADALDHALALDSALNVELLFHRLQIAGMERDTVTVRRLVSRMPKDARISALRRFQAGAMLGDATMFTVARRQLETADHGTMVMLLDDAKLFGLAIPESEREISRYLARPMPKDDRLRLTLLLTAFVYYHDLGRPADAAAALARLGPRHAMPAPALRALVIQAMERDADTGATAEALTLLGQLAERQTTRDTAAQEEQDRNLCVIERWRLARGETRSARAAIARLGRRSAQGCGVLLEALLAAAERRPEAEAAFDRLDSLLLAGGGLPNWLLEVARWRDGQGDDAGALRAIRRCRQYGIRVYLSPCLREEGRLAGLVGDRAGAIRAYRHYLALRYRPQPSVRLEVDRVRAELARLTTGSK